MTLQSVRVGFPHASVEVVDNASVPEAEAEIRRLSQEAGCEYRHLEAPIRHESYCANLILRRELEGPVVIVDPDVVFWESCEDWRFDALLAGRKVPAFWDQESLAINLPRIHPSFWWIKDVRALRDRILAVYPEGAIGGLTPFLPYRCKREGRWYKYDIGANLFAALGHEMYLFTERELECFDHVDCGMNPTAATDAYSLPIPQGIMASDEFGRTDLKTLRGLWRGQDRYWQALSAHEPRSITAAADSAR